MWLRRVTPLLIAATALTACGVGDASSPGTEPPLEIGGLPAPVGTDGEAATPSVPRSTTTLAPDELVGAKVKGNRVILIGDSVMASTAKRYTNDMCKALVPLGWQAEVDAESGRFVEFGNKVLDRRLSAGWDAAVVLLGNNYLEGNEDAYRRQLERIVERLAPDPVVLLTVTEFRPSRKVVNAVIRDIASAHDNVMILDWASTTAVDRSLTGADRLHLTDVGRAELAHQVAMMLGAAPEQPGACLPTQYTDDSMMPVTGTSVPTGSGGGSGGSDTTVDTAVTTTADPVATTVVDTVPSSSAPATTAPTATTASSISLPAP